MKYIEDMRGVVAEKTQSQKRKAGKTKEVNIVKGNCAPKAMTKEQAQALLREWQKVFEGLTDEEIDEITNIRETRKNFFQTRDGEG